MNLKKSLIMSMAICLLASMVFLACKKNNNSNTDNIQYSNPDDFIFDKSTGTITGYTGSATTVAIPPTINGVPVTAIGVGAFYENTTITNVSIPNSVTSIGELAFYACSSLTSINIPNSVTTIGEGAFIACKGLTSITIPNSVTNIGGAPFAFCSSLKIINVDRANPNYTSVNGVLYNKNKTTLIQYPTGNTATSFTVLNSVAIIGMEAFAGCIGLTSITIPYSVTNIMGAAFFICTRLTSVIMEGTTPPSLGTDAFTDTPS